jgi:hypothetical protein
VCNLLPLQTLCTLHVLKHPSQTPHHTSTGGLNCWDTISSIQLPGPTKTARNFTQDSQPLQLDSKLKSCHLFISGIWNNRNKVGKEIWSEVLPQRMTLKPSILSYVTPCSSTVVLLFLLVICLIYSLTLEMEQFLDKYVRTSTVRGKLSTCEGVIQQLPVLKTSATQCVIHHVHCCCHFSHITQCFKHSLFYH